MDAKYRKIGIKKVTDANRAGTSSFVISADKRPAFHSVATPADSANAAAACGRHMLDVIANVERRTKRKVVSVVIGKTFLQVHLKHVMNVHKPTSWLKAGMSSRWSSTYRKRGFHGLVMCIPFVSADLHPVAAANLATAESLCLGYEGAITKWMKNHMRGTAVTVDNADDGGGGRTSGDVHPAYGVYLAFRLGERTDAVLNIIIPVAPDVLIQQKLAAKKTAPVAAVVRPKVYAVASAKHKPVAAVARPKVYAVASAKHKPVAVQPRRQ